MDERSPRDGVVGEAVARLPARLTAALCPALEACLEGVLVQQGEAVVHANDAAARLFGYARGEDMLGLRFFEALAEPRDVPMLRERLARLLAGQALPLSPPWAARRKDGGRALVRSRAARLDWHGAPAVVSINLDVSALDGAEAERRALDDKLRQAQHLESLAALAGGIAHDFNNLLTTVLGYSSLSRELLPPDSPIADYQLQIERAARRAGDLCRQMLAYAGKGVFAFAPVSLADAAREAADQLRPALPAGARVSLHLGDVPAITADAAQVRQVLGHLLTNAAEALGEGGEVEVTARREYLGAARLRQLTHGEGLGEGEYVCLQVADTGCGMTPEVTARVFEPFFTTKFTGRGLGLAAVLGVMRSHGGAVEVSSRPAAGTTFRLYFPLAGGPAAVRPSEARPVFKRYEGLVLVAEDEPAIRRLADRLLSDLGLSVRTAADGREALELAAAASELRLALVDLTMPELDGPAVARQLLVMAPGLPVVLMTGYSVEDVDRAAPDNVVAMLQKPFTRGQFVEVVSRALAAGA